MQPQNQQNKVDQIKKCLLVIGKMGHGKSSFIRMLLEDRNDKQPFQIIQPQNKSSQKKPEISPGLKSCTTQCNLYKANPSHNLLFVTLYPDFYPETVQEDLYLIDTPGLNSKSSAWLITEAVDQFIVENHCEIIGIAYIIDLNQREEGQDGSSALKEFFRLFKGKKQKKKALLFCVLSNWDKLFDQQQSLQNLLEDLNELLTKCDCQEAMNRLIYWSSKPIKNFQKYQNNFLSKQQSSQYIQNQWKKLRQMVALNYSNRYNYQDFRQLYHKFWQCIHKRLNALYKQDYGKTNKKYSWRDHVCYFPMKIQKLQKKQENKLLSILTPIATVSFTNVARLSFAFLLPSLSLTGPIGISILASSLLVGAIWSAVTIKQTLKKKFNFLKSKSKTRQQQQNAIKKQVQEKIQQKVTNMLLQQLYKQLKINDKQKRLDIPKLHWLGQIQAYYQRDIQHLKLVSSEKDQKFTSSEYLLQNISKIQQQVNSQIASLNSANGSKLRYFAKATEKQPYISYKKSDKYFEKEENCSTEAKQAQKGSVECLKIWLSIGLYIPSLQTVQAIYYQEIDQIYNDG